jgi:predicted dehydrogenase
MDRRQFGYRAATGLAAASLFGSRAFADARPSRYRVAVIGHTGRGNYGHGLDTVWKRIPETDIVAVADADDAGRGKARMKLGLSADAAYADYRAMLQTVSPDLVAVCPRHVDQHCEMILAAIKAGAKGIYVEKPFVRTPREVDQVLAACQQHHAKVAVAHRNRYHPVLQIVADRMRDGTIGRVLEIRGRGKGDRRGGGEDLWVLGSHVLNMITFLAGTPRSCSAVMLQDGRPVTAQDVDEGAEGLGPLAGDELHARFVMNDGIVAYFDSIANDGTANHGFGLQIIGSEGRIAIRADGDPLAYLIRENPFQPQTKPSPWLPITTGGVNVPEPDPERIHDVQHHDAAVRDLIQAVEQDRQPLCDAREAGWTVEMICGVFKSHRQNGAAVPLPLVRRDHPLTRW